VTSSGHIRVSGLKNHRVSVLIPVYNSGRTIGELVDTVIETLGPLTTLWEIILVNDGSTDDSHVKALAAVKRHPGVVKYINLFRNFGEHNAVMCGLQHVTGDSVTIIDDDFQNPPTEILQLVDKLQEGFDVVYSYYDEKCHSKFRNLGSKFNNLVASILLKKPKGLYLSSFKTIDATLIQALAHYQGPYPYLDGLILRSTQNIGRKLCQHEDRKAGKSNYTILKLVRLWLNMFTGFSITPLRITSYLGLLVSFLSLLLAAYFVTVRSIGPIFIEHEIPAGWASTIVAITSFSGLQLIMLGMIGEYLGRLFLTINGTPQYLIRNMYGIKIGESND
jgi:undecaprenyl-phosphate 4-deoxy-4-formamido-L-arabinose transferase